MEKSPSMAASAESTEVLPPMAAEPAAKKRRNLPGMPDPDAEVIALSPKTLMATNRFVCEICSKGFQRDQNLQLHRRGHNLPWKLKQRTGKEVVRKRVYVCPEASCIHHSPARALGDLTGIKKHFCRKHGEKKWKCERCAKKYAVQSDWKAHMKVCGTKEYKCDCGTVFSRRDSFITHRAFCDALAEESSKAQTNLVQPLEGKIDPPNGRKSSTRNVAAPVPPSPPRSPSTPVVSPVQSIQSSENAPELLPLAPLPAHADPPPAISEATTRDGPPPLNAPSALSSIVCPALESDRVVDSSLHSPTTEPSASLSLFLSTTNSIFSRPEQSHRLYAPTQPQPPAMSATALLQKAAQMGATASNSSLLRGLGLAMSSSYETVATADVTNTSIAATWGERELFDPTGLGLGLASSQESPGLMMAQSSLFGPKPMTLDFLGLGAPRTGLSALLTSLESGLGAGLRTSNNGTWDGGAI